MHTQPANADINVFRHVRSQRESVRHDSVKNITQRLRRLFLVPPHEEIRTSYGDRDTDVTDFSLYMGESSAVADRGHPIVVNTRALKDMSAIANIGSADFPIEIGADRFVVESQDEVGGDLHQATRDA